MKVVENVEDLIGNTPMIRIRRLVGKEDAAIYAKLEKLNIGGSVKDRIVRYIIENLEKDGILTKDKIIVEETSGNTGIALAMIAASKGYKTIIIMPENVSRERISIVKAFGAEVILTKNRLEAVKLAHKLVEENPDKYILLGQRIRELNPRCHYETTGKEIIEQMKGKIDMFIAGIGTSGTLIGVARRLKEFNRNIKIVAVEPYKGEEIPGLLNMEEIPIPLYDSSLVDEKVNVRLKDAIEVMKRLAREEGILVGISSGAAMYVALKKAKDLGKDKNIVVIFPDGGERYVSMNVFD